MNIISWLFGILVSALAVVFFRRPITIFIICAIVIFKHLDDISGQVLMIPITLFIWDRLRAFCAFDRFLVRLFVVVYLIIELDGVQGLDAVLCWFRLNVVVIEVRCLVLLRLYCEELVTRRRELRLQEVYLERLASDSSVCSLRLIRWHLIQLEK